MKHILCMKWGAAYGPKDVNILYAMVARNISGDIKVVCFTDDTTGIRPEVACLPLPPLGCEIPTDVPGKWPKVALWSKELFGLEGIALFIDLDSVIVDNIDCYFEFGDPGDVITARNWLNRLGRSAQTSVFRFPIGGHSYMLENLRADPASISRKLQYEQNYVTHEIRGGIKFWPEAWTKHFRVHCIGIVAASLPAPADPSQKRENHHLPRPSPAFPGLPTPFSAAGRRSPGSAAPASTSDGSGFNSKLAKNGANTFPATSKKRIGWANTGTNKPFDPSLIIVFPRST
jgi:hypothetical protein